jgi:hypothetical protein
MHFDMNELPRTDERISTQRALQVCASMLSILGEWSGGYYAVRRIWLYEFRALADARLQPPTTRKNNAKLATSNARMK